MDHDLERAGGKSLQQLVEAWLQFGQVLAVAGPEHPGFSSWGLVGYGLSSLLTACAATTEHAPRPGASHMAERLRTYASMIDRSLASAGINVVDTTSTRLDASEPS